MTQFVDPKGVALSFLDHMRARDFDAAYGLLADDAIVWNAVAGRMTKAELIQWGAKTLEQWKSGWETAVVGVTAEGDRVAIEATGNVELADGSVYDNEYHLLFKVDAGGRIVTLNEYMDTAKAMRLIA